MPKVLFISVKPEYANKIVSGEKTIELRKSSPNVQLNDWVLIYSTQPVMAVIGFGKVKKVIKTSPTNMWRSYSRSLGIDKKSFDLYYENWDSAVGIEIGSICKLNNQIVLSKIKSLYPKFSPPQTFKYFSIFEVLRTYQILKG